VANWAWATYDDKHHVQARSTSTRWPNFKPTYSPFYFVVAIRNAVPRVSAAPAPAEIKVENRISQPISKEKAPRKSTGIGKYLLTRGD
jgi:hypothetical protein